MDERVSPRQESVWEYPRPPRVEPVSRRLRVVFNGVTVAETRRGLRVIETGQPPAYYFPPEDVRRDLLEPSGRRTFCEWKGTADHFTLQANGRFAEHAAWSYAEPTPGYEAIRGYLAFYPARVDACYVDDEAARAQPDGYYGGWVTSDIAGPFGSRAHKA